MQKFSKRISQKLSKLSDSQIKILVDSLSEKEEMFDSIFQSLSTGIIIVSDADSNFKILVKNKAAERFLPFIHHHEDFSENLPVWNLIGHEEIAKFLKSNFESNKTNVSDEFTLSTSSGIIRFVDISITPFVHKKMLAGSIVRVEDVTEKRNQEILLHRMEAMAGLTNVAANVAHEIKNPLGAISIHIQLIQKAIKKRRESDGMLPDEKFAEKYLDVVNSEIDRLNKIVVDFLMAVRPISAKMELLNPNELLSSFVEFFTPEFNSKKVKIEAELCENCPRLLIDSKLFREVIVNFAQNSLSAIISKFGEFSEGGIIRIRTKVIEDKFIVSFSDNGVGMNDETVSRVFEPYFTTKANGTGLGMAMSYKVVKEFRGDIAVSSALGEGTEFVISLPVPQKEKRCLPFNG